MFADYDKGSDLFLESYDATCSRDTSCANNSIFRVNNGAPLPIYLEGRRPGDERQGVEESKGEGRRGRGEEGD